MKSYDYLIVGAGLFGSVFAHEATRRGKRCLLVERRSQVGGNCFCQNHDGIVVHAYGAHIFHTDSQEVWDYVNEAAAFRQYSHSVVANYQEELFNLPFNMNTFYQLWGVVRPEDALAKITEQRAVGGLGTADSAKNLEERALSLVGPEIYEKLIKHYTEKQWGRPCSELPAFIINRLPLRFAFNNNYFNDSFQGIPSGSYNDLFDYWLNGVDLRLNCDYLKERESLNALAGKIVYTGALDAFYAYRFGALAYRSLVFENERIESANVQGCAVMNYTDKETPYTRVIEHRHFNAVASKGIKHSIITREYAQPWDTEKEAYYPINDIENNALYARYKELATHEDRFIFGGRLADYRYYDMDDTIAQALATVRLEFG